MSRTLPLLTALRRLQADWKAKGYGLRELIHLITTNELLRQP